MAEKREEAKTEADIGNFRGVFRGSDLQRSLSEAYGIDSRIDFS